MNFTQIRRNEIQKGRRRKINNVLEALNFAKTLLDMQTPRKTILRSVMFQNKLNIRDARAVMRKVRTARRPFKHGGKPRAGASA